MAESKLRELSTDFAVKIIKLCETIKGFSSHNVDRILQNRKGEYKMTENRLIFLKDTFSDFKVQFSDDFSSAVIVNPNYNENLTVYDEGSEFTVCFSFHHCHLEDEEEVVDWICEIVTGRKCAIEFFSKEQRRFGSEIASEEIQDLTYEKLEQSMGYFGLTMLLDVVDSFKVRAWDSKNNFDFTFSRKSDGAISINKTSSDVL